RMVLGSALQRGGTYARYRPAVHAPALVPRVHMCGGVRPGAGFFSRACGGAPLCRGAGGARRGGGDTPPTPHPRHQAGLDALWTRAPCLTWRGGEGCSSNALYGYSSPLPLARQFLQHRVVSPSGATCLLQPAERDHDRSFFWVGTGMPGIFTLTAPKCVRLVK